MKTLALAAAVLVSITTTGLGDEARWPKLEPGEVKVLGPGYNVPDMVREAAGYAAPAELPPNVKITLFMTEHRREYAIISPCCGKQGAGASLFTHVEDKMRPESLSVGDPRKGFTTQPFADAIVVEEGAKALKAQIVHPDCEDGTWSYYYQFDDIGRPILASVIDAGCAHLGTRELYHVESRPSHWWQQH